MQEVFITKKRSKFNNNLESSFGTVNDESDFEAYYVTNEECWSNPYEEQIVFEKHFDVLSDTEKEYWKKWFEAEKEKDRSMTIRRQEGFNELSKWFSHLWD